MSIGRRNISVGVLCFQERILGLDLLGLDDRLVAETNVKRIGRGVVFDFHSFPFIPRSKNAVTTFGGCLERL